VLLGTLGEREADALLPALGVYGDAEKRQARRQAAGVALKSAGTGMALAAVAWGIATLVWRAAGH